MEQQKKAPEAPPETRVLLWEGEPVLSFSPPKVSLPAQVSGRVIRYYRRLEQMWRERWEGEVYQRACRAAAEARAGSRPFEPWKAALTAQVSESEGVLLVCWEASEQAGRPCCRLKREEAWQLPGGTPVLPAGKERKKRRKEGRNFI